LTTELAVEEEQEVLLESEEVEEQVEEIGEEEVADEPVESEEAEEEVEEEDIVTLNGESLVPEEEELEDETPVIRQIRQSQRETSRENKELKRKLKEFEEKLNGPSVPQASEIVEPTMENCNFDEDVYREKLKKFAKQEAQKEIEAQQNQEYWKKKVDNYQEKKKSLKIKNFDFQEAENHANTLLNTRQQELLLEYADNPALAVLAIGVNKKAGEELASIQDPIRFAMKLQDLQKGLNVERKKRVAPKPVKKVHSNTATFSKKTIDKNLERALANPNGDMNEALRLRRAQQANRR
jgi:hypothetical protein